MSNFELEKTFTIDFKGDKVTYTLQAPTVEIILKMQPYINGARDAQDSGDTKKIESMGFELLNKFEPLIVPLVSNLSGLVNKNGEDVSTSFIFQYPYFTELAMDIYINVMSMANPSDEIEKKLEDTLGTSATVPENQVPIPPMESMG